MNTEKEIEALVTDNIRLVFYCYERLPKTVLTIRYRDDLISEGNYGLFKAARSYDSTRSKFSTYAMRCITNEMTMFIRRARKWMSDLSLETEIHTENNEMCLLKDLIQDPRDYISEQLAEDSMIRFIGKCRERDRQILFMRESGMSMTQIGRVLGHSQSYVSKLMKDMRKRYHAENDEEQYGNKKN